MRLLYPLMLFLALVPGAYAQAPASAQTSAVIPLEPRGPGFTAAPSCASHHSFLSAALARNMDYCLILPSGYNTSHSAYPVLYLLHGLWGNENDWLYRTKIAEYVHALPLIVVMPEADDSWYINSAVEPRNRYEDYLEEDLVREVDSHYRTITSRDGRFIAGLSMGGYGAFKAGLRHPEQYSMVGAFSSAFAVTRDRYYQLYKTPAIVFGPANAPARRANDVFLMAAHADPATLPNLFITCGTEDDLLHNTTDMTKLLSTMHIAYESHLMPGNHEWTFWDRSLRMFLHELQKRLPAVAPAASQ